MSKIKINLANGSVVEKPLVTCFKGTNGDYIVLDNETNGSMGYPIICISKINGSSVSKIVDQSEWASVKENLKTIIGGTALPYLNVPESLSAPEDFFTQLTLPVASFDLLKSVYSAPSASVVESASLGTSIETEVAAPAMDIPIAPMPEIAPITSEVIAPVPAVEEPIVPAMPEIPEVPTVPEITMPTVEAASVGNDPLVPIAEEPVMPMVELPTTPIEMAQEVHAAIENSNLGDDLATIKENFMKSCETMFDALVKKFENK